METGGSNQTGDVDSQLTCLGRRPCLSLGCDLAGWSDHFGSGGLRGENVPELNLLVLSICVGVVNRFVANAGDHVVRTYPLKIT